MTIIRAVLSGSQSVNKIQAERFKTQAAHFPRQRDGMLWAGKRALKQLPSHKVG